MCELKSQIFTNIYVATHASLFSYYYNYWSYTDYSTWPAFHMQKQSISPDSQSVLGLIECSNYSKWGIWSNKYGIFTLEVIIGYSMLCSRGTAWTKTFYQTNCLKFERWHMQLRLNSLIALHFTAYFAWIVCSYSCSIIYLSEFFFRLRS